MIPRNTTTISTATKYGIYCYYYKYHHHYYHHCHCYYSVAPTAAGNPGKKQPTHQEALATRLSSLMKRTELTAASCTPIC